MINKSLQSNQMIKSTEHSTTPDDNKIVHLVQIFLAFPINSSSNTFVITAQQWSQSRARLMQSIFTYLSVLRFSLMSSSHLCRSLPIGLFASEFPTKSMYAALISSHVQHLSPPNLTLFDSISLQYPM
jgi:hypothetical protein